MVKKLVKTGKTGERIREERESRGFNQTEFGQIGGVSRNTQASYERGERNADTSYLSRLATAGVDVMYILSGQRSQGGATTVLSPDEAVLVDNYRCMPEEKRGTVMEVAVALAELGVVKRGSGQS
jgi:transcriptional regulator with XRE-family HTH domain